MTARSGQERESGNEQEPDIFEKIFRLHEVLSDADIPHAFGGALAADYYRIPRGTIDIDLALFVPPSERERVLPVLERLFPMADAAGINKQIVERDQAVTQWGDTRIDLFFSVGAFHRSVASRIVEKDSPHGKIPILSAEDIIVFKALFDRSQDWADIEAICELQDSKLDRKYVTAWLKVAVGADDHRLTRFQNLGSAPSSEIRES